MKCEERNDKDFFLKILSLERKKERNYFFLKIQRFLSKGTNDVVPLFYEFVLTNV